MQSDISSKQYSVASNAPTRFIVGPAQVALLLQRLMRANSRLTVTGSDKQIAAQCFISSVDSTQLTLEICSADNADSIGVPDPVAAKLQLTSQLDGVLLSFSANVIKPGRSTEKSHIKLDFPKEIESTQQRENYRILPRMMNRPAVQIEGPASATRGEIVNLSMGGALALLSDRPGNEEAAINTNGQRVKCAITFDENSTVIASARVCHHHRHPATGQMITGLTFLSLDRKTRQQLQQQTSRLERENARWR